MNKPIISPLPRGHDLFREPGLFIASALFDHMCWGSINAGVIPGADKKRFDYKLKARHHRLFPRMPPGCEHCGRFLQTCSRIVWKQHSWSCCLVRTTVKTLSSVVCPSSFAEIKLACFIPKWATLHYVSRTGVFGLKTKLVPYILKFHIYIKYCHRLKFLLLCFTHFL